MGKQRRGTTQFTATKQQLNKAKERFLNTRRHSEINPQQTLDKTQRNGVCQRPRSVASSDTRRPALETTTVLGQFPALGSRHLRPLITDLFPNARTRCPRRGHRGRRAGAVLCRSTAQPDTCGIEQCLRTLPRKAAPDSLPAESRRTQNIHGGRLALGCQEAGSGPGGESR